MSYQRKQKYMKSTSQANIITQSSDLYDDKLLSVKGCAVRLKRLDETSINLVSDCRFDTTHECGNDEAEVTVLITNTVIGENDEKQHASSNESLVCDAVIEENVRKVEGNDGKDDGNDGKQCAKNNKSHVSKKSKKKKQIDETTINVASDCRFDTARESGDEALTVLKTNAVIGENDEKQEARSSESVVTNSVIEENNEKQKARNNKSFAANVMVEGNVGKQSAKNNKSLVSKRSKKKTKRTFALRFPFHKRKTTATKENSNSEEISLKNEAAIECRVEVPTNDLKGDSTTELRSNGSESDQFDEVEVIDVLESPTASFKSKGNDHNASMAKSDNGSDKVLLIDEATPTKSCSVLLEKLDISCEEVDAESELLEKVGRVHTKTSVHSNEVRKSVSESDAEEKTPLVFEEANESYPQKSGELSKCSKNHRKVNNVGIRGAVMDTPVAEELNMCSKSHRKVNHVEENGIVIETQELTMSCNHSELSQKMRLDEGVDEDLQVTEGLSAQNDKGDNYNDVTNEVLSVEATKIKPCSVVVERLAADFISEVKSVDEVSDIESEFFDDTAIVDANEVGKAPFESKVTQKTSLVDEKAPEMDGQKTEEPDKGPEVSETASPIDEEGTEVEIPKMEERNDGSEVSEIASPIDEEGTEVEIPKMEERNEGSEVSEVTSSVNERTADEYSPLMEEPSSENDESDCRITAVTGRSRLRPRKKIRSYSKSFETLGNDTRPKLTPAPKLRKCKVALDRCDGMLLNDTDDNGTDIKMECTFDIRVDEAVLDKSESNVGLASPADADDKKESVNSSSSLNDNVQSDLLKEESSIHSENGLFEVDDAHQSVAERNRKVYSDVDNTDNLSLLDADDADVADINSKEKEGFENDKKESTDDTVMSNENDLNNIQTASRKKKSKTVKPRKGRKSALTQINSNGNKHEKVTDFVYTTGDFTGVCKICEVPLMNLNSYQKHLVIFHQDMAPYTCLRCNKNVFTFLGLKTHIFMVHKKSLVECIGCRRCTEMFEGKDSLEDHLRNRHGFKLPLSCNTCYKLFDSKSSVERHIKMNHSQKKSLKSRSQKREIQAKPKRPRSKTSSEIRLFRYKHDEFKGWCDICGLEVKKIIDYQKHLRLKHLDNAPYTCVTCDENYFSIDGLVTHINVMHGINKIFGCRNCDRLFDDRDELEDHLVKEHEWVDPDAEPNQQERPQPIVKDKNTDDETSIRRKRKTDRLIDILSEKSDDGMPSKRKRKNGKLIEKSDDETSSKRKRKRDKFISKTKETKEVRPSKKMKKSNENPEKDSLDSTVLPECYKPQWFEESTGQFSVAEDIGIPIASGKQSVPLMCQHCSKRFLSYPDFKEHLKEHISLFKCEICNIKFRTEKSLLSHQMRIHFDTLGSSNKCLICRTVFATAEGLKDHQEDHMLEIEPGQCAFCDVVKDDDIDLIKHVDEIHIISTGSMVNDVSKSSNLELEESVTSSPVKSSPAVEKERSPIPPPIYQPISDDEDVPAPSAQGTAKNICMEIPTLSLLAVNVLRRIIPVELLMAFVPRCQPQETEEMEVAEVIERTPSGQDPGSPRPEPLELVEGVQSLTLFQESQENEKESDQLPEANCSGGESHDDQESTVPPGDEYCGDELRYSNGSDCHKEPVSRESLTESRERYRSEGNREVSGTQPEGEASYDYDRSPRASQDEVTGSEQVQHEGMQEFCEQSVDVQESTESVPIQDTRDCNEQLSDQDVQEITESVPIQDTHDCNEQLSDQDVQEITESVPIQDTHDCNEQLSDQDVQEITETVPIQDTHDCNEQLSDQDVQEITEPVPIQDTHDCNEQLSDQDVQEITETVPIQDTHDCNEQLSHQELDDLGPVDEEVPEYCEEIECHTESQDNQKEYQSEAMCGVILESQKDQERCDQGIWQEVRYDDVSPVSQECDEQIRNQTKRDENKVSVQAEAVMVGDIDKATVQRGKVIQTTHQIAQSVNDNRHCNYPVQGVENVHRYSGSNDMVLCQPVVHQNQGMESYQQPHFSRPMDNHLSVNEIRTSSHPVYEATPTRTTCAPMFPTESSGSHCIIQNEVGNAQVTYASPLLNTQPHCQSTFQSSANSAFQPSINVQSHLPYSSSGVLDVSVLPQGNQLFPDLQTNLQAQSIFPSYASPNHHELFEQRVDLGPGTSHYNNHAFHPVSGNRPPPTFTSDFAYQSLPHTYQPQSNPVYNNVYPSNQSPHPWNSGSSNSHTMNR